MVGIKAWIPLISKLVWPVFILMLMLIFNAQVEEMYRVVRDAVEQGRGLEIGFVKLGEAASQTDIKELAIDNVSIDAIGGLGGVARKDSAGALRRLKAELRRSPSTRIDTLLVTDATQYSVKLLKEYISALGLSYVTFQKGGRFDGWISASTFTAQLPEGRPHISYQAVKSSIVGIRNEHVETNASAKEVLDKMQTLHVDSIPVVDSNRRWRFFANRGEILARLMTSVILGQEQREG